MKDRTNTVVKGEYDNYKISNILGGGIDGTVYNAKSKNKDVVIKIYSSYLPKQWPSIYNNESKLSKKAGDLGLGPKVLDYFLDKDRYPHIVFEKIIGITLQEYFDAFGFIDKKLYNKVLKKINYMHENNIYHGDLQPQNIMISINNVPKKALDVIYNSNDEKINNACEYLNVKNIFNIAADFKISKKLLLAVYFSVKYDKFDIYIIDFATSSEKSLSKQDKEEDLDLFTKNALFNDDITKYLKDSI